MSISRSISRTSAGWTRPAATRWTPSLGPTRLDPKRSYKPLDVGNGIVSGTVTPNGRWLSLGITHRVHGRVVLSDADALPDDQRLEQGAVRAYRASLASPSRKGFGLALLASGEAEAFLVEDSLPLAVLDHPGYARFETLTLAPRGRTGALQIVRVAAHEQNIGVGIEWHGRMRLGRAAYTQLTPGGALPAARSNTTTGEDGQLIWFDDRDLGASAAIALPTHANLPAGMSLPFIVAIAFGDTLEDAVRETVVLAGEAHDLVGAEVRERRSWWQGVGRAAESDRAIRRAAAYALDCAAARAGDDLGAVLADHEILPLVWTRDAYYICRMLRDLDPPAAAAVRTATLAHFTDAGRFAYAVRGASAEGARHYHDANDLPTVFAPGWGFCDVDDPVWRATLEFAWSRDNDGYFPGELGGLGSLHTRHPWPLGDLQDIVVARLLGDAERERRGWERLDRVETWDGLLPEAYDEATGAVASRHWFAWPAALRALLALDPMLKAP